MTPSVFSQFFLLAPIFFFLYSPVVICLGVFHCNVNNPPLVPEQSNQTEFSAAVQYEGIIFPYVDTEPKIYLNLKY